MQDESRTTARWRLFLCQPGEPLHGLRRQIGTGELHCPVLTQRRLALFSLAALCVWRVDPAPNDPGLLAAKGGAAGGGCALMRTLGRYSRHNSNGRG